MPDLTRIAVFGGIYNNYLALEAALADVKRRGVEAVYCLGDLGAFGPHPDRVFPLLLDHGVLCIQGNYDNSVGNGLADCQCGYTDPRDNHFARISYDYTFRNTSPANRAWMQESADAAARPAGPLSPADVSRQPAEDERIPLGIDDADALPRAPGRRPPGRRDPDDAHRHQVAPPPVRRPPFRQRRRPGPAGERRAHQRLVRAAGGAAGVRASSSSRWSTITNGWRRRCGRSACRRSSSRRC